MEKPKFSYRLQVGVFKFIHANRRFVSMSWVVLAHTHSNPIFGNEQMPIITDTDPAGYSKVSTNRQICPVHQYSKEGMKMLVLFSDI